VHSATSIIMFHLFMVFTPRLALTDLHFGICGTMR
jgi:hypothetical protein